jgi:pimeloyl-ACP methyl ester carboxylesterase
MTERATVMLVHGAWHGAWCWDDVRVRLHDAGIATVAVDNPSVTRRGADLRADVDHVRAALDAVNGPVVLVGHSYGGAVVSEAAAHPNVVHTVFLTAFPLEAGESVATNRLTGGEDMDLAEAFVFDGDSISVDPDRVVHFFFHDCDEAVAAAACDRLLPMSFAAMSGTAETARWREKPSTYVVCTDDHTLPVALQRSGASRVDNVIELHASHSPFLSRPDDVARIISAIAVG